MARPEQCPGHYQLLLPNERTIWRTELICSQFRAKMTTDLLGTPEKMSIEVDMNGAVLSRTTARVTTRESVS